MPLASIHTQAEIGTLSICRCRTAGPESYNLLLIYMEAQPVKIAALVTAFIMLQVTIVAVCFSRLRISALKMSRLGAIAVLIALESISVVAILLGAYTEIRWQAFSSPLSFFRQLNQSDSSIIVRKNNPALLEVLDLQRPAVPRPEPRELTEFQQWQTNLRRTLKDDIFRNPEISISKDISLHLQSTKEISSGVTRESVLITGEDGTLLPAYIFFPKNAVKRPAVLVVPGHVREHESGIEQTGVLAKSYQRAAALKLAEAGFVTLTPELRGFGQLGRQYSTEHRLVAYNAILAGSFYKAIIVNDIKRAIDLLQRRPEVDPERIGITGVSLGGEIAVTYAALDPRIKAIVFQAYGGAIGNNIGVTGSREDQPHYCHLIPGENLLMRKEDIFLLLAPRPTLGVRGSEEPFQDPQFRTSLQEGWSLYGASNKLRIATETGGHEYFVKPAVEFFRKQL